MSEVSETKVKVLAFFERETIRHSYRGRPVWVCISMKMVGDDLGISEGKARWATEKLVEEGKLKKQHFGLSNDHAYSYMVVDDEEEEDD